MTALDLLQQVTIKTTLVFATAGLAALTLRRASASARYLVWTCALIAALLLPLLCLVTPAWQLARTMAVAPAVSNSISFVVTPLGSRALRHVPGTWLLLVWTAGAAVLLVRLMAGHWRLRRRFSTSEAISDVEWRTLLLETAQRLGVRRHVVLLASASVDVPLSFGLWHPTIVLPAAAETWSVERREVVLVHELIHVQRADALWNLLARLAVAMHWFHPLAWFALAQLRREQERSCDDGVITSGIENTVYAGHLVEVARIAVMPVSGALGMAESFDLERRVRALLDPARRRNALSRGVCAAVLATALAALLPLAGIRGQTPASQGSLSGSVFDPSGARIPNATVNLRNTEGAIVAIDQADAAGDYVFRGMSMGRYDVEVSAPAFAPLRKSVSIVAATPARLNLALNLIDSMEFRTIVTGTAPRTAAPTTSAEPQRIRVGGNVQFSKLISKTEPLYPPDAEAEGVEGSVIMRAVISKTGNLLSVTPIDNGVDARLIRAAEDAVRTWQYEPTLLNGEPIEVVTTISIAFRLK